MNGQADEGGLDRDATEAEVRAVLRRHGYNPDLAPRGVSGPAGEFPGYRRAIGGGLDRVSLRNWVCGLDGIGIDGHSDPDNTGLCIFCGRELP
jgi:hypothetical protein